MSELIEARARRGPQMGAGAKLQMMPGITSLISVDVMEDLMTVNRQSRSANCTT